MYFEKRLQRQLLNKFSGKQLHRFIYKRQNGKCNWCQQPITLQTGWHLHHLIPKHMGGKGNAKNLVMLHPVCHVQVHHQKDYCCADHKRLKCLSRMQWKLHVRFWGEKEGVIPLTYPTNFNPLFQKFATFPSRLYIIKNTFRSPCFFLNLFLEKSKILF